MTSPFSQGRHDSLVYLLRNAHTTELDNIASFSSTLWTTYLSIFGVRVHEWRDFLCGGAPPARNGEDFTATRGL